MYVLSAVISFGLNLLVMAASPVLALIPAVFKLKNLPGPLWYLQTHDDWIYGHGHPKPDVPKKFLERWKLAMWWLARNPAYAFDAHVLGIDAKDVVAVKSTGTIKQGVHDEILLKNGKKSWGYRRDLHYGSSSRYCKMWFGWHSKAQAGYHMLKFDINPFKKEDK
jgi:hypothetical protein